MEMDELQKIVFVIQKDLQENTAQARLFQPLAARIQSSLDVQYW